MRKHAVACLRILLGVPYNSHEANMRYLADSLLQVFDQVFNILDAHAQPDQ
jgi:hypothetical protein